MPFQLTLLGTNSAVPAYGRHPTAQVLQTGKSLFLLDCGEGTQMRMSQYGISRRERIREIFITHLHGDHIYGLPGLLTSFSLNNRTEPLTIFSPPGLREMIEAVLKYSHAWLNYEVNFAVVPTDQSVQVFENKEVTVHTVPLEHRVPTTGYLFREKPGLANILPDKIAEYNIHFSKINAVKAGGDFVTAEGKIIPHAELTRPPAPPRSYAFCTDTVYSEAIIPLVKGVDLLYHETTYVAAEQEKAVKYAHSTTKDAARIAKAAAVGRLICGHFSSRYTDLSALEAEAREVFPNSSAGIEGQTYSVEKKRTS